MSQQRATTFISLEHHHMQDLVGAKVDAVELKSVTKTPHASEEVQDDMLDCKRGRR